MRLVFGQMSNVFCLIKESSEFAMRDIKHFCGLCQVELLSQTTSQKSFSSRPRNCPKAA